MKEKRFLSMNFGKKVFLLLSAFVCTTSVGFNNAFAASTTCAAGKYGVYDWGAKCWDCPNGCFCIGGYQPAAFHADHGWCGRTNGISGGWGMYAFSKDGTGSSTQQVKSEAEINQIDAANEKIVGLWEAGGLRRCPKDFPNSGKNSTSIKDCYTMIDGKEAHRGREFPCTAGKYRKAGSGKEETCKRGSVCDGKSITVTESIFTNDFCISTCADGTKPNKDEGATECVSLCEEGTKYDTSSKGCVSICESGASYNTTTKKCVKSVVCEPGTYLPSGADKCDDCKLGYACPGITTAEKPSEDKGLTKCDVAHGKVSDDKTKCITTGAHCEPGNYLPGNRQECEKCSGSNKYCPGGDFDIAEIDQGIADCPYGGKVNSKKSGCKLSITKDIMMYGYSGAQLGAKEKTDLTNQCWTRSDIEDFSKCVLGN